MPTLLRIIVVLLTTGVLYAGIALLAFAEVIGTPDGTRLALGSLAVCALATPPMLAGVFASYWSWDASARRRLRVTLGVLLAVQGAGAIGLIVLTLARSGLVVAAVVLVAIAGALDPAAIALGRTARRVELRRGRPEGGLDAFRARVAVGWRRGGIGAAIGLAVGILTGALLLLPLARSGNAPSAVVFAPIGAGLGASIGMLTVAVSMAGRVRDLLGGDASSARRIGRAVRGKPEALTADEQVRAARYAVAAPAWIRLQVTQSTTNALAVVAILALTLLGPSGNDLPGAGWLLGAVMTLLIATVVAAVVLLRRRTRALGEYAAAHPLPD